MQSRKKENQETHGQTGNSATHRTLRTPDLVKKVFATPAFVRRAQEVTWLRRNHIPTRGIESSSCEKQTYHNRHITKLPTGSFHDGPRLCPKPLSNTVNPCSVPRSQRLRHRCTAAWLPACSSLASSLFDLQPRDKFAKLDRGSQSPLPCGRRRAAAPAMLGRHLEGEKRHKVRLQGSAGDGF